MIIEVVLIIIIFSVLLAYMLGLFGGLFQLIRVHYSYVETKNKSGATVDEIDTAKEVVLNKCDRNILEKIDDLIHDDTTIQSKCLRWVLSFMPPYSHLTPEDEPFIHLESLITLCPYTSKHTPVDDTTPIDCVFHHPVDALPGTWTQMDWDALRTKQCGYDYELEEINHVKEEAKHGGTCDTSNQRRTYTVNKPCLTNEMDCNSSLDCESNHCTPNNKCATLVECEYETEPLCELTGKRFFRKITDGNAGICPEVDKIVDCTVAEGEACEPPGDMCADGYGCAGGTTEHTIYQTVHSGYTCQQNTDCVGEWTEQSSVDVIYCERECDSTGKKYFSVRTNKTGNGQECPLCDGNVPCGDGDFLTVPCNTDKPCPVVTDTILQDGLYSIQFNSIHTFRQFVVEHQRDFVYTMRYFNPGVAFGRYDQHLHYFDPNNVSPSKPDEYTEVIIRDIGNNKLKIATITGQWCVPFEHGESYDRCRVGVAQNNEQNLVDEDGDSRRFQFGYTLVTPFDELDQVNCEGQWVQTTSCDSLCGDGTFEERYIVSQVSLGLGDDCPNTHDDTIRTTCNNDCQTGGIVPSGEFYELTNVHANKSHVVKSLGYKMKGYDRPDSTIVSDEDASFAFVYKGDDKYDMYEKQTNGELFKCQQGEQGMQCARDPSYAIDQERTWSLENVESGGTSGYALKYGSGKCMWYHDSTTVDYVTCVGRWGDSVDDSKNWQLLPIDETRVPFEDYIVYD